MRPRISKNLEEKAEEISIGRDIIHIARKTCSFYDKKFRRSRLENPEGFYRTTTLWDMIYGLKVLGLEFILGLRSRKGAEDHAKERWIRSFPREAKKTGYEVVEKVFSSFEEYKENSKDKIKKLKAYRLKEMLKEKDLFPEERLMTEEQEYLAKDALKSIKQI
jgi:hypothetical protein